MNNKGVSSEGPSITSIPKEGQSIARRSKERIPKELLEWEFMLLTTNDETWDKYFENFRMMIPERCADKSKGKRKKEADDKIKEGTLNLDDGTDAITVVFGKEKGGYARGVGSGVTYKRYFHLPRSRQATDERIEFLQTQLYNK
ncbi:hypothetical protein Tco_1405158 [Tanacetum coccineum]